MYAAPQTILTVFKPTISVEIYKHDMLAGFTTGYKQAKWYKN